MYVNRLVQIVRTLSDNARRRRSVRFRSSFVLDQKTRILDIGSEDGSAIAAVLAGTSVHPGNVYIADIDKALVSEGHDRYGFTPIVIEEAAKLPFEDAYFDIVYCSSVIEHVTVPKASVWELLNGDQFARQAWQRQTEFANEIRRIGRGYFVQTPNKWFIVESHSWLPFVGWLPRTVLVPLLALTNRIWIKRTAPDWYLLTRSKMRKLFPEATLARESFFGMTKSLMAIKSLQNDKPR